MTTTHQTRLGRDTALAQTTSDLVLLVARVGLGVIMLAHAKLEYDFGGSLAGVGRLFAEAGVPLATLTGPANVLLEVVGGVALIVGAAVRIVSVLMAVNMAGAWVFAHPGALFAMDHTGPETVIALGLLSLVLAVTGSGRFGVDHVIAGRVHRSSSPSRA
jgi:putative oxidoreductase